jgi:hypothetical protein
MDGPRFDTLTRSLTAVHSRRSTLGGLLAGALALLGVRPEDAQASSGSEGPCQRICDDLHGKCNRGCSQDTLHCYGDECLARDIRCMGRCGNHTGCIDQCRQNRTRCIRFCRLEAKECDRGCTQQRTVCYRSCPKLP